MSGCGQCIQVPYSKDEKGYGVLFKDEYPLPVTVKSTSPHAQVSNYGNMQYACDPSMLINT